MEPQQISCGNTSVNALPVVLTILASMEPQQISCGNNQNIGMVLNNGMASMEPQQISCGNTSLCYIYSTKLIRLQWSHNKSVVETWAALRAVSITRLSFNGATTNQLWKPHQGKGKGNSRAGASMEPQQISCGNRHFPYFSGIMQRALQWSHNKSVVETHRLRL